MKKESIYNFNNCLKVLIGEIRKYSQSKELKSKKKKKEESKMTQFVKYLCSLNRSFFQSKMKLLWPKNKFTKNFMNSLENFSFDEIIPLIIEILCGNFSKAKKLFISDENNRPIIFYLLPINDKKNILFSICIRIDYNNKSFANEYIYFLAITEECEYKNYIEEFQNKINLEKNKNKYPEIKFDKIGLYSNHNMFFEKVVKDEITKLDICFPVKKIELYHEIVFDKNNVSGGLKNDPNEFQSNEINNIIDLIKG